MKKNALLVVDIQNDFLPGGALAVADGNKVIPIINALMPHFGLVVATQDWHPRDHGSFASNHPGAKPGDLGELGGLPQVFWPDHCVQGTFGAAFHRDLDVSRIARVFRKGTDPEIDSYSGFFDNGHRKATGLGDYVRAQGVTDVYVAGLATDYCVRWTALDALQLGFRTHVVADASRGVNLKPDDSAKALEEVRRAGGEIVQSDELVSERSTR